MKRSFFSRYLRLEIFGIQIVLGLGGVAFLIRATTDDTHSLLYLVIAGTMILAAAIILFRAARKL